MRKYIYNILIICVFIGLQNNCHAQRKETFRAFEDSIIHMHRQILNEYNATLRYQKNEKLLQLFHDVLEMFRLSDRAQHKPQALSGGEQQRIAVARALVNKPSVVFADEPSGNLDTENAKELHQLFLDLRDELQQTFVIVTHNPLLSEMADRTLYMTDGRLR